MSKNIMLEKKYSTGLNNIGSNYIVPANYYYEQDSSGTILEKPAVSITTSLDSDVDVFTELPKDVYKNEDVALFLSALRKEISKESPKNVTLSKLLVSEKTNTGITLDWIYNYFRLYFSFDKNDGDHFGFISYNSEDGSFSNEFRTMKRDQFSEIAKKILNYVIMMIQG